ncbi:MAG: tRNA methyl transferase PRC-barrel domain-containing protein, partial [Solirubrobacteraceae bacterium]
HVQRLGCGDAKAVALSDGVAVSAGPIVELHGAVLGAHAGAHRYTVGQRHGLGISAPEPLYVLATNARANTVTVGPRDALLAREVPVSEATLHRDGRCVDGVRVRAHGRRFACRLSGDPRAGRHPRLAIELHEPAERTAPGQLACLYAGDVVVGHGIITA